MSDDEIQFEVDFHEAFNDDPQAVREAMIDAEETLPEVVRGSQVSAAAAENKEKLGLEWLPILQVLVSAPAVLLLLRELGKIVNGKLNAPTKIKLRRTVAKGQTEELQLDTTTLTSEDTRALVDRFFGKR